MKNVRYECYSDFLRPSLQETYSTLNEARSWRRDYESWSEVWIERVEITKDGAEFRRIVH